MTHGDADVGSFERGCVVDPVAGHRDDLAAGLECFDESEFVIGADPGENVDLVDGIDQLVVAETIEVVAGEDSIGTAYGLIAGALVVSVLGATISARLTSEKA